MSKSRGSPRKFSEKIALLNKKEVEATAEFEKILKEVGETTRTPAQPMLTPHQERHFDQFGQHHQLQQQSKQYYGLPQRSSSFSNWQRCAPQLHHPLQHQQHDQNNVQYLAQPVQYNSDQMNHQQQTARVHVFVNQQQERPYINPPAQQHQHQPEGLQSRQQHQRISVHNRPHMAYNKMDLNQESMRPASLGVPNIEIFQIDDDQAHQQVNTVPIGSDTLASGHLRHSCSNSSISSARSLPNIANLSVSPTNKYFMNQSSNDHRLMLSATATTPADTTSGDQLSPEPIVTTHHHNDSYLTNDYYNNEDYCSLPSIQEPILSINPNVMNGRNQTSLPRNSSWQSVATSSAPCSAAPTPPPNTNHGPNGLDNSQQQLHQSPSSTSRQQSPHLLHQDYYPHQQLQSQGQMIRASSANVIHRYPANDLLETPQVEDNLSKSSEAYYGYLNDYVIDGCGEYSNNGHTGNGDEFDNACLNVVSQPTDSPMRTMIGPELQDINIPNDCKQQNQCMDTNQQQCLDTSQYSFYG